MADLTLEFQSNLLNLLNQSVTSINNINANLQNTMQKQDDIATSINKVLIDNQQTNSVYKESNKELATTVDKYNDIEKATGGLLTNMRSLSLFTGAFSGGLRALFGGLAALLPATTIVDAINEVKDYQQTFIDISYRMGQTSKAIGPYTAAMHEITASTGLANSVTSKIVTQLAQYRVSTKDVASLGTSVAAFSEVTGVAYEQTSMLAGELMRTGRLSKTSTQSILLDMAKIQRAVGMTNAEMTELSDNIVTNTRLLNNMGKTSSQIDSFAKTTTKLSASFVQVGLKISDAQDILEKFLDPTQFEDNALLYAKLGYNLSDVINGSIPQEDITNRLKGLSQQVKGMGMAGVELAKQLNIPYRTLTQMSEMEVNPLANAKGGTGSANDQLTSMMEQQKGFAKQLEATVNIFQNKLTSAFDKVMPALTKAASFIRKFISDVKLSVLAIAVVVGAIIFKIWQNYRRESARASVDTSKKIGNDLGDTLENKTKKPIANMGKAVNSALKMNAQKALAILDQKREIQVRVKEEAKQQRKEGSFDYKKRAEEAAFLQNLMNVQQLDFTKKMTGSTSFWLQRIQKGADITSLLAYKTEQINQKMKERVELNSQDINSLQYMYSLATQEETAHLNAINARKRELESLTNSGKLTGAELVKAQDELKGLYSLSTKLENDITKKNIQSSKDIERALHARENLIKTMSNEQLASLAKESKENASASLQKMRENALLIANNQISRDALQNTSKELEKQIKQYESQGVLTGKQLDDYLKANKNLNDISAMLEQINSELGEQQNQQEILNSQHKEELDKIQAYNKELQKRGIESPNQVVTGQIKEALSLQERFKEALGTSIRNVGQAFESTGNKIKMSASIIGKNLGERLNPKNWLANMKEAGVKGMLFGREKEVTRYTKGDNGQIEEQKQKVQTKGLLNGMKGIIGGLGASLLVALGPMQILSMLWDMLKPVIEPLKDAISGIVDSLVKALVPVVLNLAKTMVPVLIMFVNKLVPPLLFSLSYVIKAVSWIVNMLGEGVKFLARMPDEIGYIFKPGSRNKNLMDDLEDAMNKTTNKNSAEYRQDQAKIKKLNDIGIDNLNGEQQKELQDLVDKYKYGNNALMQVGQGITEIAGGLNAASDALFTLSKNKEIISKDAEKKIIESLNEKYNPKPENTSSTTGQVTTEATPTTYAINNNYIKKVQEGTTPAQVQQKQTEALTTTASASQETASNVSALAQNQEVATNVQQLTYQEIVKLNNNFSTFFSKLNLKPNEGIGIVRSKA